MKKRLFLSIIFALMIMFTFCGCETKEALGSGDFKAISEGNGFTISDATSQYTDYGIFDSVTISSKEGYSVEFYDLTDSDSAVSMFNTNKDLFLKEKQNNSTEISLSASNYSYYGLTTETKYLYICRVNDTLLYVNVDKVYKDEVKSFVDQLGY